MTCIDRSSILASGGLLFLLLLPLPGLGDPGDAPRLHDCGDRICGEWKPKGDNTCRTCETAQCKEVSDGEALAGTKKETECYEGHGAPPPEDSQG